MTTEWPPIVLVASITRAVNSTWRIECSAEVYAQLRAEPAGDPLETFARAFVRYCEAIEVAP